jgi:ribonuclease Y
MENGMNIALVIFVASAAAIGFWSGWLLRQSVGTKKIADATNEARNILDEAKAESENLKREKLLEAKEQIFQMKQDFEREAKDKQREFYKLEKDLSTREVNLDRKVDILNKKEKEVSERTKNLNQKAEFVTRREAELEQLVQEENVRLEQISGLTSEEARAIQMKNILDTTRRECAAEVQEIREQTKREATKEARDIILQALERSSISHVVDTTVSVIQLPDDEMKGRIIGREGRNIRAFEAATGIEVLIDDTPRTVTLSGFNPIRRAVARQSMDKLIYDGRIHPGRIEEVVDKSREEIDEKIIELGEQIIHDIGIHGVHAEMVRLLGKQHFRTTYGQNLLLHSKEVAVLAGQMAAQLGLDIVAAKRAGLLHDIGKTAEDYGETPHYDIGVELAKKFGESEIVQNAIAAQAPHDDVEIIHPLTVLVKIADAVSVSRPGAQKEMLENYITRMTRLEEIAMSFSGVLIAYALQAGRELRIMVEHAMVDDAKAQSLADKVVKRLQEEMEFPGQIKISVIREYRAIDFAK